MNETRNADRYALSKLQRNLETLNRYQMLRLRSAREAGCDTSIVAKHAAQTRQFLRRASRLNRAGRFGARSSRGLAEYLHGAITFISALVLPRHVAFNHAVQTAEGHLHTVAASLLSMQTLSPAVRNLIGSVSAMTEHAPTPSDRILISQTQ